MNKAELLRSSDLGHSQADDTVAWLRTQSNTSLTQEHFCLIAWHSAPARREHPGQMGTMRSVAWWDKMVSRCLQSRGGHWLKYLRDDGLAVACAKHKVVYSHGRRVGGALRRALSQPGALPASCKAAVRTEATVPCFQDETLWRKIIIKAIKLQTSELTLPD